nr:hypothetical protein [Tanacetum cinerariifolium]
MANRQDLRLIALAFFTSVGKVPSARYLKRELIQVSPSSSTIANISISRMDFSFNSSTNTCLLKCAKLVEAILLKASAFLFSLLGICLIENALKLPVSAFTFPRFFTPICSAILSPAIKASYYASLFVASDLNLKASGSSSSSSIRVSGESTSGLSTMKSANICPLTNTLGL